MKFARYLQDTQTSEWKKAYINYHRLKVQLGIIRAKVSLQSDTWSSFGDADIDHVLHISPESGEIYDNFEEVYFDPGVTTPARIAGVLASGTDPTTNGAMDSSDDRPASSMMQGMSQQEMSSFGLNIASPPLRVTGPALDAPSSQALLLPRTHRTPPVFPRFRSSGSPTPRTLHTILSNLPAIHAEFFDMLDAELDKIETFYTERAKEMHERAKMLRKQLDELEIHRQMFYESSAHMGAQSWAKRACLTITPALSPLVRWFRGTIFGRRPFTDTFDLDRQAPGRRRLGAARSGRHGISSNADRTNRSTTSSATLHDSARLPNERWDSFPGREHSLDPREYRHAKRRLRQAVVEHYRGLGVLNNYRTLNLTGFRKALRKYGKITKTSVMDAYMKDKVEPSAFGSGAMVSTMLKETEQLFAARFEHGNRKKAMNRLRVGSASKTYHSSTLRSGVWLGLAVPAIGAGCYLSFQEYTRGTLPSWNILLFIYSIFVVPLLLALLVGINILVWADKKISYVFIFRLNLRSKLDHHEYFELPSFLLCTLAYAFWFSLAQIGSPMLWPLIWLALTLVVMFNPFRRFMWGGARWWTIKKIAKLALSGVWEVEFTDVWLGDQLCSLMYSLSNLYSVGCFYTHFFSNFPRSTVQPVMDSEISLYTSFLVNVTTLYQAESSTRHSAFQSLLFAAYSPQVQDAWSTCSITQNWGWYYLLGILPLIARVVQNLRRYRDSKLPSQLLNAGKYGMGMIYYIFYCYWRNQMNPHTGKSYTLWCFMATVNAIYGYVWDIVMDWGLCKPHARYPLLRSELLYKSHLPYYYFTMVFNLCIRFNWVALAFVDSEHYELCSFIVALLEMLRRVQWNFYRLENKHLHNTGLHRIVHEVPLPYSLEMYSKEEARLRKRIARLS